VPLTVLVEISPGQLHPLPFVAHNRVPWSNLLATRRLYVGDNKE